ncbi:hypothetical protein HYV85_02150 [Candidatus Woesearchaeota archaeon]|nr:hypothetical protein [Candidatus Woesearchaeota archaeon]
MIHLSTSLKYYKREDVQQAIVEHGRDKEAAARFNEQFGKRPDILTYPGDVLELAKQGATSFHCSEELWTNPMLLVPQMEKKELDKLRKGWDLLLDVDCAIVDYSKIAAYLIVKELKLHGVRSVTIKFSGNKGFHIAVPYEAFPQEVLGKETRELFPEAPKKLALYIKERIKKRLGDEILKKESNSFANVAAKTGKKVAEITSRNESSEVTATDKPLLNPEPFLVIDTLLISPRHMYRMPYSLHEKSGLASVPVDADRIMEFSKEEAAAEKVKVGAYHFMERKNAGQNEAERLFLAAYDFGKRQTVRVEAEKDSGSSEYEEIEGKIPQQYFPACIKKMLDGVADGRKRALFVLVNFLRSCNYGSEEIEAMIKEWNQRNREPLPHLSISSHLSYHKQGRKALPPNCSNASYYKEIGIECTPECGTCKNPVAEAKQIYRRAMRMTAAPGQPRQPKKRKQKREDSNL